MIREVLGLPDIRYNQPPTIAPMLRCDCCNGVFAFAPMYATGAETGSKDLPPYLPLTSEHNYALLAKFCPYCGARNTEPKPSSAR